MFCYLFKMYDRTTLSLFEKENCFDECEFCKDGECIIAHKRSEKMTKDRFGWVIESIIEFIEPKSSKSGSTKYLSSINLIHPSSPEIWIVKCERLNKAKDEEEWYTVYRLYRNGNCVEFDDLVSLNKWFKREKYDGRPLTEEDFSKKEGENNAHNKKKV